MTSDGDKALKRARDLACRYLSLRDRSRAELSAYLEKKGVTKDAADAALEELAGLGYVDDARFAAVFARYLVEYKGLSRYSVRFELRKKGVSEVDAVAAADAVYGEEGGGDGGDGDGGGDAGEDVGGGAGARYTDGRYDELAVAMGLARKKAASMRGVDEKKARRCIMDHLRRKGYSFDIIRRVMGGLE